MVDRASTSEVLDVLMQELDTTGEDIAQMRGLVADAVARLGDGFERIAGQTKEQQQLLEGLLTQVSDGDRNNGRISLFIDESQRLVGDISGSLEKSSERVLRLASRLDAIDATFRKLSGLTDAVNEVSKEIRVLAFNAHLEATRAGDRGKGFSVVANAVRELSENFRVLSDEIHDVVEDARESIVHTVTETRSAAAADQRTVQRTREKMECLHVAVGTLSKDMAESLHTARRMGQQIHHGVSQCVQSLQFDDLIGQLCQGTQKRLLECRILGEQRFDSLPRSEGEGRLACVAVRTMRSQHRAVQQTSLDAGDVEFF